MFDYLTKLEKRKQMKSFVMSLFLVLSATQSFAVTDEQLAAREKALTMARNYCMSTGRVDTRTCISGANLALGFEGASYEVLLRVLEKCKETGSVDSCYAGFGYGTALVRKGCLDGKGCE